MDVSKSQTATEKIGGTIEEIITAKPSVLKSSAVLFGLFAAGAGIAALVQIVRRRLRLSSPGTSKQAAENAASEPALFECLMSGGLPE
jgi:hypothetical protein